MTRPHKRRRRRVDVRSRDPEGGRRPDAEAPGQAPVGFRLMLRKALFATLGARTAHDRAALLRRPRRDDRVRPRRHRAHPARMVDRRGDRARRRAHRPRDRRLPQRHLWQRARVDHRPPRRARGSHRGRPRVADRVGGRQPAPRAGLLAPRRRPRRDRPLVDVRVAGRHRVDHGPAAHPVGAELGGRPRIATSSRCSRCRSRSSCSSCISW